MSVALFDTALTSAAGRPGGSWYLRGHDGVRRSLQVERWFAPADEADRRLLDRADGPVLDVGCGPGRLTSELTRRGVYALGVDVAEAAVAHTRAAGGRAVRRSVWAPLPGAGRWGAAVLADGNVGIGGDPARLLGRVATLLRPGGKALVEVDPPGSASARLRVRLESAAGPAGDWFAWAVVSADDIPALGARAGLRVLEVWAHGGRWFAELARGPRP